MKGRARRCGARALQAPGRVRVVRPVRQRFAFMREPMSRFRAGFNQPACSLPWPRLPVAEAPRLPERNGRVRVRRRIVPVTAARTAADKSRKRHPPPRPPAVPGHAFCAVFAAGRHMLAARPGQLQDLAGPMLVDGKQRVSEAAPESHFRPPPAPTEPHRSRRLLRRKPAAWTRGGAGSPPPAPDGAIPRTDRRAAALRP